MARHTSVFYNLREYREQVPEELRYRLRDAADPGYRPLAFRARLGLLAEDVAAQGSLPADLESLFIVLNLKLGDLEKLPLPGIFRELRDLLKSQAGLEFAPPGNPAGIARDTKFRLCPAYDLARDPDIVSARQNRGAANLGRILENRVRTAFAKIGNFAVCLHVFESLFLVAERGACLNAAQRYCLQRFIESEVFPAGTHRYLQSCFSQIVDLPPIVNDLSPAGAYLKPLKNPAAVRKYLNLMSETAALAETPLSFAASPLGDDLASLTRAARLRRAPESRAGAAREKIIAELTRQEEDALFADFKSPAGGASVYGKDPELREAHRAYARRYFRENGFVDPAGLTFVTGNRTIAIGKIAVSGPDVYVAASRAAAARNGWDFAVNADPLDVRGCPPGLTPRLRTGAAERRESDLTMLAGILGKTVQRPLGNAVMCAIGANLEYRLLAEGLCGDLPPAEIVRAFSLLADRFMSAAEENNGVTRDLRWSLAYLGDIISCCAFLYRDLLYPAHIAMMSRFPEFGRFAVCALGALKAEGALTPEKAEPLVFEAFILPHPVFNLNIRAPGMARGILYGYARRIYAEILRDDPAVGRRLYEGLVFTGAPQEFTGRYPGLAAFRRLAVAPLLPGEVRLSPGGQEAAAAVVARIKREEANLLAYLNGAGSGVRNETVYRILERGLGEDGPLPAGLAAVRAGLLAAGSAPFAELRRRLGLASLSSHACCVDLFARCAAVLGITMFPDPEFEDGTLAVSAFDFIAFGSAPLLSHPRNRELLLPYRLALCACAGFKAVKLLERYFLDFAESGELEKLGYDPARIAALKVYAAKIADIKANTNLRLRLRGAGAGAGKQTLSALQIRLFRDLLGVMGAAGEAEAAARTVRLVNRHLSEPVAGEEELRAAAGIPARSGIFGGGAAPRPGAARAADSLDMDLISRKTEETRKVQEILAPIFDDGAGDAEPPGAPAPEERSPGADPLELLAPEYRNLLKRLLQLREFTAGDFASICAERRLMPSGALEVLNSWALEQFECTILEEDDPMFFDRDLLAGLTG